MPGKPTLAARIAAAMQSDLIDSGELSGGDRLPTVMRLQERYGVSGGTVMQALGVLEARGLVQRRRGSGCYLTGGTRPPPAAPPRIAFVHPGRTMAELLMRAWEGIQHACSAAGYQVVFASVTGGVEAERERVAEMIAGGCAGLILYPHTRTRAELRADYLARDFRDTPIVLLDIAYPEQKRPGVLFDNVRAGYDMTRLLLARGHERIAFMEWGARPDDWMHRSVRDRHTGYLRALREAAITPRPTDRWNVRPDNTGPVDLHIARLLRTARKAYAPPTAVIATDDHAAAVTIGVARELGIRIPDELEVTGFDDLAAGRSCHPRFPTTAPDFIRAGEIAAELLLQQLRGAGGPDLTYLLPVPLLKRKVIDLNGPAALLTAAEQVPHEEPYG